MEVKMSLPPKEIWLVSFECRALNGHEGNPHEPIAMVARSMITGNTLRYGQQALKELHTPPFLIGSDSVCVSFAATDVMGCFLSLGWSMPEHLVDLYAEFRVLTNGTHVSSGNGLLGALIHFGIDHFPVERKLAQRQIALASGQVTPEMENLILDYCASEVVAMAALFNAMQRQIDMPRALFRGKYVAAAAQIERNGVPVDMEVLELLRDSWPRIEAALINTIDADYGVYQGHLFQPDRFAGYLEVQRIPWPRHETGMLDLNDDTFKEMAKCYPCLGALRELRATLSQRGKLSISVGEDGRNRCDLSLFRSKTGRNQPSSTKCVFGPAVWVRSLIKPPEGQGLLYADWRQQEFGIAAALSGDQRMMDAYLSSDPYLKFAKQAGVVPEDATGQGHEDVREQFKGCALAVLNGMGTESLAKKISQPKGVAERLMDLHASTYRTFWSWSNGVVNHGLLHRKLWTIFGWTIQVSGEANTRSLRNFPLQATAAEMLRVACILLVNSGIKVCATVHDALLVEAPLDRIDEVALHVNEAMREASSTVLNGFYLNTDMKVIRYPDRFMDKRGVLMWNAVMRALKLEKCEVTHG